MKKILLPILALGGLLFASSCQMDEPDAGTLTGEVDFTITAGIPGSINTYASNDGGSTNVDKGYYDQRFILEVYDGENYTNLAYREVKTVEVGEKTSFDVRLLAKKYTFALWADFVTNGITTDYLYNTSDGLDAVTINHQNRPAGQEIADAYCYSEEVNLTEGSLSKSFTLRRPFGKIRLISTDKPANDVNNSEGYTPESVTVTYGTDVLVPTGYNVLTGEASGEIDAGNYIFKPYKEEVTVGGTGKGELYILGIDYILASKSMTNVSFDVQVDDNGTRRVTNIPVSANKLTTVVGNFYTNEGNIDVIVEDDFGSDEVVIDIWDGSAEEPAIDPDDATYFITTPAELAWVAEQVNSNTEDFEGKTILLMNDIDLSGSSWTPIGNVTAYPTVTFKGTFDGQEHIISNLTASDNAAGYAAAGLFGSILGTVKNVTLKDVNIRSTHYAGAVVGYSSTNGAIIENCHVDGGTITSVPEFNGTSYDNGDKAGGIIGYYVTDDKVTNCSAKNLTITAYRDLGGITGCGPQSGMTGCSVENITLVQDNTNGYESEAVTTVGALGGRDVNNGNQPYDGGYASAVTKNIVATSNKELAAAAIADNATIYLKKGEYVIPAAAKNKTVTFIGTGNPEDVEVAVTKVGEGGENCDFGLDGSNATFEGITITTNSSTYIGYARCNGTYKNCIINFNVSGDVYNIWTWGAPNATFDGCIFNSDGKAMLLYGGEDTNLTINNCTFNDDEGLADLKKAAIEIGDDYGSSYVLIVNNTVVSGFAINDTGYNTGTTLWANKNSMPKERLSVTVDGEIVY